MYQAFSFFKRKLFLMHYTARCLRVRASISSLFHYLGRKRIANSARRISCFYVVFLSSLSSATKIPLKTVSFVSVVQKKEAIVH
jgi:hypothetical protein